MSLPEAAPWAWIPLVIWAGFAQTVRNAAQRSLVSSLGTLAATLVRFLYGVPFALAWVLVVQGASGASVPHFDARYAAWLTLGAVSQIAATACLLTAMRQRNFIIGVTLSKTEVLQLGILAAVFLQEWPTPVSAAAMVVATVGVVLLSLPREGLAGFSRASASAAAFGLASGGMFALASVGYRGAALQMAGTSPWVVGAWNVLFGQVLQSLLLGGWLMWRQPGTLTAVARAWRVSTLAGLMGALASIGWLTAYALRTAVDVRTLGLVEVLFSFAVSRQVFQERLSARELGGLACVLAGVVAVTAGA